MVEEKKIKDELDYLVHVGLLDKEIKERVLNDLGIK